MAYRQRLSRDLDRWIAAGWVEAGHRDAILGDVDRPGRHPSALGALMILGAVLLGLSALTFVGANWDALPRLLRFGLILAALWASLLGAGQAFRHNQPGLGHALALVGVVLFGAGIILTAQSFNLTSFRNTAVLVWAAAGGLSAWLVRSRPVVILATGLAALWAGLEAFNPYVTGSVWAYLPIAAAGAVLAARLGSRVALHLGAVAAIAWTAHAIFLWSEAHDVPALAIQASAALVFGALAMAAASLRDRGLTGGGIFAGWMTVITLVTAFLLQWPLDQGSWRNEPAATLAHLSLAAPALVVIVGLTVWRWRRDALSGRSALALIGVAVLLAVLPALVPEADGARLALRLALGAGLYAGFTVLIVLGERQTNGLLRVSGVTGFVLQTLYVYAETFSGLLDTALFFLVGGLILFAVSYGLWRARQRRATAPSGAGPHGPGPDPEQEARP